MLNSIRHAIDSPVFMNVLSSCVAHAGPSGCYDPNNRHNRRVVHELLHIPGVDAEDDYN